jgi:hypothetical protein
MSDKERCLSGSVLGSLPVPVSPNVGQFSRINYEVKMLQVSLSRNMNKSLGC